MNNIQRDTFLSPVILNGPFFNGCDCHISPKEPAGDLRCDIRLETPQTPLFSHEAGRYCLLHDMQVNVRLIEMDENKEESEAAHFNLEMSGSVYASDTVQGTKDEIEKSLRINAVSLFYSSARAYIEFLSGQSSMQRFTIPAIDPVAYIDSLE